MHSPNACDGLSCGTVYDRCGEVACGTCSSGNVCEGNQYMPKTCAPRRCTKGFWWSDDDCQCEESLPR